MTYTAIIFRPSKIDFSYDRYFEGFVEEKLKIVSESSIDDFKYQVKNDLQEFIEDFYHKNAYEPEITILYNGLSHYELDDVNIQSILEDMQLDLMQHLYDESAKFIKSEEQRKEILRLHNESMKKSLEKEQYERLKKIYGDDSE